MVFYIIGSSVCWLKPTDMIAVLIGQFIKNIGGLSAAYVFTALFADTLGHPRGRRGFVSTVRAMAIFSTIGVAVVGLSAGLFNGMISSVGYVAPHLDGAGALVAAQSGAVQGLITFAFVGLDVVIGVALIAILLFFNAEKDLPAKQAEIARRHPLTEQSA